MKSKFGRLSNECYKHEPYLSISQKVSQFYSYTRKINSTTGCRVYFKSHASKNLNSCLETYDERFSVMMRWSPA